MKTMKKLDKTGRFRYLPKSPVIFMVIIFIIAMDFVFIKQLTEAYFADTEATIFLSALVIVVCIDLTPSILAGFINMEKKRIRDFVIFGLALIALLTGFMFLAQIRIHSEELIYQTSSMGIDSMNAVDVVGNLNLEGKRWMTYLFCFMPLFTSIISFVISLLDGRDNKKDYIRQLETVRQKSELIDLEGNQHELELELKRDLISRNNRLREIELDDLQATQTMARELIRFKKMSYTGEKA